MGIWSAAEPTTGLLCCCLLTYMPLLRSFFHKIGLGSSHSTLSKGSDPSQPNPPSTAESQKGQLAEHNHHRFSGMVKLEQSVWIGHVERTSILRGASRSGSLDEDVEKGDPDLLNGRIMIKREITIRRDSRYCECQNTTLCESIAKIKIEQASPRRRSFYNNAFTTTKNKS